MTKAEVTTSAAMKVKQIIQLYAAGIKQAEISRQLNVSDAHVCRTCKKYWKEIQEIKGQKQPTTPPPVIVLPQEAPPPGLPDLVIPKIDPTQDAPTQLQALAWQLAAHGMAGYPLSVAQRDMIDRVIKSAEKTRTPAKVDRKLLFHIDEIDVDPLNDEKYQTLKRETFSVKI